MKRILTFIFLVATISSISAQGFNFTAYEAKDTGYFDPGINFGNGQLTFINLEGLDINARWEWVEDSLPTGWDISHCDPTGCQDIGVTTNDFVVTGFPTQRYYINTHFYPNGVAGVGKVVVKVYPQVDSSTYHLLTFRGYAFESAPPTPTAIEAVKVETNVSVSPNPASTEIEVSIESNDRIESINIIDITGQLVQTVTPNNSVATKIDISTLESGIYFIKVIGETQNSTQKLLVK